MAPRGPCRGGVRHAGRACGGRRRTRRRWAVHRRRGRRHAAGVRLCRRDAPARVGGRGLRHQPRRRQGPDRDGHHPAEGVGRGPQGAGDHGRQPVLQHARARQRVRAQARHRRRRPPRPLAALLRQLLRAARLRGRAARHGRDEQLDRLPADGRPVRASQRRRRHRLAERPPAGLRQGRQPGLRELAQRQDRA